MFQEGVKTENDHINLKVAGQDGSVVQFKIKRHTPLSKLMKAYCERQVSTVANQTPCPPTCCLNGEDWSRGTLNIAHRNIVNRADLITNTIGISVPCISNVSSLSCRGSR